MSISLDYQSVNQASQHSQEKLRIITRGLLASVFVMCEHCGISEVKSVRWAMT